MPSEFKRRVRPLSEIEFFKANEYRAWLFYIGPVLFSFAVNERLYERFTLLSFSIRLLMISSAYANDADDLIKSFLSDLKEDHSEHVFTANVHSLMHLSWQVRQFGPLWTSSAMMFESANYLLQSKLTGTVNQLPLLVERYKRNKESYRATVENDILYDFCHKLRGTKTFVRRSVPFDCVPHYLKQSGRQFFSNYESDLFTLDSISHTSTNNSYIAYVWKNKLCFGQVKIFYINEGLEMLSVNCFSVLEKFQCSRRKNLEIYSFVVVENSDRRVSIPLDTVKEKCMAISTTDKFFLTPLLCMTEHD